MDVYPVASPMLSFLAPKRGRGWTVVHFVDWSGRHQARNKSTRRTQIRLAMQVNRNGRAGSCVTLQEVQFHGDCDKEFK